MKKSNLLTALLVLILVNCNSGNKQESDDSHNDLYMEDNAVIDSHTSETSLDWAGVYEGVMPTEDGEGAEVTLELKNDLTYVVHYNFLGKPKGEKTLTNEGPFTWNDDGNSISLQAEDKPTQYKVSENLLFRLDEDGEVITGRMADVNVLQKVFE